MSEAHRHIECYFVWDDIKLIGVSAAISVLLLDILFPFDGLGSYVERAVPSQSLDGGRVTGMGRKFRRCRCHPGVEGQRLQDAVELANIAGVPQA
jgi:hypothetical protein